MDSLRGLDLHANPRIIMTMAIGNYTYIKLNYYDNYIQLDYDFDSDSDYDSDYNYLRTRNLNLFTSDWKQVALEVCAEPSLRGNVLL